MNKTFCDICKNELTRNMVDDRLIVEQGGFKVEALVSKDGCAYAGDLCFDCLMKMLILPPVKPCKPQQDKGTHKGQTSSTVEVKLPLRVTDEPE